MNNVTRPSSGSPIPRKGVKNMISQLIIIDSAIAEKPRAKPFEALLESIPIVMPHTNHGTTVRTSS